MKFSNVAAVAAQYRKQKERNGWMETAWNTY